MFYNLPRPVMRVIDGGVLSEDDDKLIAWKRLANLTLILAIPGYLISAYAGYRYGDLRLIWANGLGVALHLMWVTLFRLFPEHFQLFIRVALWQTLIFTGLVIPVLYGGHAHAWTNQVWSLFMLCFGFMFYPRREAWVIYAGCMFAALLALALTPYLPSPVELPPWWNASLTAYSVMGFGFMLSLVLDIARTERQHTLDRLATEKQRGDALLLNILPQRLADDLIQTGSTTPARHEQASVIFVDLVDFTELSAAMPPERLVQMFNELYGAFDDFCAEEGVEKIKTIGDAYMAAAGVPEPAPDHAHRCVRLGLHILDFVEQRNQRAALKCRVRIGIHSGPVVAGVVGKRKYAFDIWGDTVNIASRMESAGEPGKINVSAYTYDLIMANYHGEHRGKLEIKGKGAQDMYFISGAAAATRT